MKTIKYLLIAIALFFANVAPAQNRLSDEEREFMQIAAKQKLDFFQDQLAVIASRRTDRDQKDRAVKTVLDLFVGKGEPYTVYDNDGRALRNTGVKMQISMAGSSIRRNQLMKQYLNRLRAGLGHSDILIESASIVMVENVSPEQGTDRYYATAKVFHRSVSYGDESFRDEDFSVKTIKFYVDPDFLDSPDGSGPVAKVLLGDVVAVETME